MNTTCGNVDNLFGAQRQCRVNAPLTYKSNFYIKDVPLLIRLARAMLTIVYVKLNANTVDEKLFWPDGNTPLSSTYNKPCRAE